MYALISTRKGLIVYHRQNHIWSVQSVHFRGIPISLSHYDQKRNILWAFLDHGHWGVKVHRSFDFGKTWEEIPAPKYPEGAEITADKIASLRYIWACQSTKDTNGISMWIGTDPGGLFGWHEENKSWVMNTSLWNRPERMKHWFGAGRDQPGIHSILINPSDENHFHIGVSCGGVYETFDGGSEWHSRNKGLVADFLPDPHSEYGHDPHMIALCEAEPNVLWQQNHCGIFRSSNSGELWEEVSEKEGPAVFGFGIIAHPTNPEVAWVAPGVSDEIRVAVDNAMCICRTEDGGKTWEALRKGLPQENVFDIVYRHGITNIGEELMFGSTTGNLYFSNDGGDGWQSLSNHLPMVYAVEMVQK